MPISYLPVPDGYVIWRDNTGKYSVAKRPVILHGNFQSRTKALYWLYTQIGKQQVNESEQADREEL